MNKNQISYIVTDILKDNLNTLTCLRNCASINVVKSTRLLPDINKIRFYFDHDNEVLKVYQVRLYSTDINLLPEHGNYSIIEKNNEIYVFEIMSDNLGNPIYDVYEYDKIVLINAGKQTPDQYMRIIKK